MKLTAKIKLQPTPKQYEHLKATLEEANSACNWISNQAFTSKRFGEFKMLDLVYAYNLSAHMLVRAIAKAADRYRNNAKIHHVFHEHGAFPYDSHTVTFDVTKRQVSIWTLEGREWIPFIYDERDTELLRRARVEDDLCHLCFIEGQFYLFDSREIESPGPNDVEDLLVGD